MRIFVSFVLLPFLVEEYRRPLLIETLLLEPSLDFFAPIATPFLDFSDELFHASLRFAEIVVNELSPLAFDFARQLFQFSLCLIGIHTTLLQFDESASAQGVDTVQSSNSEAIRIKPRSARLLIRPCK